jgi:hypothetical protein
MTEHFQTLLLAADETVLLDRIVRVAALNFETFLLYRGGDSFLGALLGGPTDLVGGEPQVSAGD